MMLISIETSRYGPADAPRFRAEVTVGDAARTMPSCYTEAEALTDALAHIKFEIAIGDASHYPAFHAATESQIEEGRRRTRA